MWLCPVPSEPIVYVPESAVAGEGSTPLTDEGVMPCGETTSKGAWEIEMNTLIPDGGMMRAVLEGESLDLIVAQDDETGTTVVLTLQRK